MRILVTGDRGYLGSVLVPMLQRAGHSVVGLDIGGYSGCPPRTSAPRYEQRTADVHALQTIDLAGFDAVVHLAEASGGESALSEDGAALRDGGPESAQVLALAARCRQAGVSRFVYPVVSDLLNRLQAPEAAVTPLLELHTSPGFIPIVLSNAAPFGFSPCMRLDTVLNGLVAHALVYGEAIAPGGGRTQRPFVHVRDVSRAINAVLRLPEHLAGRGQFEIVRRRDMATMAVVTAHIAAITGARISFSTGPEPLDATKAATIPPGIPGFTLRFHIPDGVRELCRGLSRRGLNPAMLQGTPLAQREAPNDSAGHAVTASGRPPW